MGYLNDIITIIHSSIDDIKNKFPQSRSIVNSSMDGTMQFPCLISDTINMDTATAIMRVLERVYASFVQTVISMNNTVNIGVNKNAAEYIKSIHTNVLQFENARTSLFINDDETDSFLERLHDGTCKLYMNEKENVYVFFNMSNKATRKLLDSNKDLLTESLGFVDLTPIVNVGNSIFYEKKESPLPSKGELFNQYMDGMSKEEFRKQQDFNQKISGKTGIASGSIINPLSKDGKKLNDMQPYIMQAKIMAVNDQNEFVEFMEFMVGVKVIIHPIKSNDMIYNVRLAIENNGRFFNFLKWTTGEKSLVKDLLLNINNTRLDVANHSAGSSPWWLTLKRLKENSRMQTIFMQRHKIVPNATLVISSYEVETIKSNYGYDLTDENIALKVMSNMFLMTFIIVDEGSRMVHILYDGQSSYQMYSIEMLEKESKVDSTKISNELMRMIRN